MFNSGKRKGTSSTPAALLEPTVPPAAGSLDNKVKELKVPVLDTNPSLVVVVIEIW